MSAARFPSAPILLVDDESAMLTAVEMTLAADGITNVVPCPDSSKVMGLLAEREFSAVLLDITMPNLTGSELLPRVVEEHPGTAVIMLTGVNEVETAVRCMKDGAFDYLVKPVDDARLTSAVRRAVEMAQVRRENRLLAQVLLSGELQHPEAFAGIVTPTPPCARSSSTRRPSPSPASPCSSRERPAWARSSSPLPCTGSAAGPARSSRSTRPGWTTPSSATRCSGTSAGGFTGAERDRQGLIEQAAGGTLFLDEIGDLAPQSQIKLLRLLQEGRYYPIGSDVQKASDARVIVATNRDFNALQQKGEFRKDLYYRLRTHHIHLPPLRKRAEDLPLLVEHFLAKAAASLGKKPPTAPRELVTLLGAYAFPGNIRELEGMVFDAVSRHKSGVLSLDAFREKMGDTGFEPEARGDADAMEDGAAGRGGAAGAASGIGFPDTLPTLKDAEQALIDEALRRAQGNQTVAAGLLGLSRRALNNRLRRQ